MGFFVEEFNAFEIDQKVKNIHLSLVDSQTLLNEFIANKDFEWAKNPWFIDNVITYLRQYKSGVNILEKLKKLENIDCNFIVKLAKDIKAEYSQKLFLNLKAKFNKWFDDMLFGFCDDYQMR